jgi:hypothetical protein
MISKASVINLSKHEVQYARELVDSRDNSQLTRFTKSLANCSVLQILAICLREKGAN